MEIRELQAHQHSASLTTGNLRVQIRPFRDEHGREFEEVVIQSMEENCPIRLVGNGTPDGYTLVARVLVEEGGQA